MPWTPTYGLPLCPHPFWSLSLWPGYLHGVFASSLSTLWRRTSVLLMNSSSHSEHQLINLQKCPTAAPRKKLLSLKFRASRYDPSLISSYRPTWMFSTFSKQSLTSLLAYFSAFRALTNIAPSSKHLVINIIFCDFSPRPLKPKSSISKFLTARKLWLLRWLSVYLSSLPSGREIQAQRTYDFLFPSSNLQRLGLSSSFQELADNA